MDKSIVDELYQNFINSQEYEKKVQKVDAANCVNISWLNDKLNFEEEQKLEKILVDYSSQNGKILFEGGFNYAWKVLYEIIGININLEGTAIKEELL